jgi:Protein of unknown function (DUF3592)
MEQFDWRVWAAIGAGVALVAGVWFSVSMRREPNDDEIEQKRRSHINQVGRIAEGQILEVLDVPREQAEARGLALFRRGSKNASADARRKLVCYSYSISGVSYETAQDITRLEAQTSEQRLVPGRAASIKYDPSNPGDSIVLTDDWSGLH